MHQPHSENHRVALLGATGSIGTSTLRVLRLNRDRYQLWGISGYTRLLELAHIAQEFTPPVIVVPDGQQDHFLALLHSLPSVSSTYRPLILSGQHGLEQLSAAPEVTTVVAAIMGGAGLRSTYAAVQQGKRVLLANKESLVMAGHLLMPLAQQTGAVLLPVDSEHNAIFQCLPSALQTRQANINDPTHGVEKIILTASGGPFRGYTLEQLKHVSPQQACKHPNWSMGQKISVDSATLMNKGLELIEAVHLFGVPSQFVDILVHPESIVHSMVVYKDGSVLAQLGSPDMCTPIAHALAWPQRITAGVSPLQLLGKQLNFEAPDEQVFPCLSLAKQAIDGHAALPIMLNASNEVAVAAFLAGTILFTDIAAVNAQVLHAQLPTTVTTLEAVLAVDTAARALAHTFCQTKS